MRAAGVLTVVLVTILSLVTGCNSTNQFAKPSPTPTSPQPSPTPTPTPTPGTTQWSSNVTGATGTVTVSTAGDVTIQVTKAPPSMTFVGNFCQYPGSAYSTRGLDPCFALQQSFTTDGSGNGQLTFHFPKSGPFSGSFNFAPGGDTNSPSRITTDNIGTTGTLSAPLVPLTKVNGGPPGVPTTQEPGSGSASLSNGSVMVTLKGGTPSVAFTVFQAFSDAGSATQPIGTLNTDASGNASGTFAVLSSTGTIFDIERNVAPAGATAGLVTGFTVP